MKARLKLKAILWSLHLKGHILSFPSTGDLFTEAADAAMAAMKGRLANQYYMKAEEAWALMEEGEDEE